MAQFKKGISGNKNGRPKGTSKDSVFREMFEKNSQAICEKIIEKALEGDPTSLKMCLDRILPTYKPVEPVLDLAEITGSLSEKSEKLMSLFLQGSIPSSAVPEAIALFKKHDELVEDEAANAVFGLTPFSEIAKLTSK